jgi:hypothetical protein
VIAPPSSGGFFAAGLLGLPGANNAKPAGSAKTEETP